MFLWSSTSDFFFMFIWSLVVFLCVNIRREKRFFSSLGVAVWTFNPPHPDRLHSGLTSRFQLPYYLTWKDKIDLTICKYVLIKCVQIKVLLIKCVQINVLLIKCVQINVLLIKCVQIDVVPIKCVQINMVLIRLYFTININLKFKISQYKCLSMQVSSCENETPQPKQDFISFREDKKHDLGTDLPSKCQKSSFYLEIIKVFGRSQFTKAFHDLIVW